MKILYGTTNQAKFLSMARITGSLGIELISLRDLNQPLPEINETGNNPLENAQIKAKAYYEAFSIPVFSCDSGLYFDGFEESAQPGTHTRRVNGRELSDEEMIEYYSGLARQNGGKIIAKYCNAIYFIADESSRFSCMDKSLETEPFILIGTPHPKRNNGFPLDSLSIDIATGRYYYDLPEKSVDESAVKRGFRAFWERVIEKCRTVYIP